MTPKFILSAAAAMTAFAGVAIANPADLKAEEMCTGAATSDDYPRWSLITDTCAEGESICTIERRDGETASYSCPVAITDDDDDGTGGNARTPRSTHQQ